MVDVDLFVFPEPRERYDSEDLIVYQGIVEVM